MAFINSSLLKNLSEGKRTQFIINTGKKVAYRLAIYVTKVGSENLLVMLTNYNFEKARFEKKIKKGFYATSVDLNGDIAMGNLFELPLRNEETYREKNDYISLINMSVFNTKVDTAEVNNWFRLAKETQADMYNNYNWLRSYYHLSIDEFVQSKRYLNDLKESVANSPESERGGWAMPIKVLDGEINILTAMGK